jgi:hypothetical protein
MEGEESKGIVHKSSEPKVEGNEEKEYLKREKKLEDKFKEWVKDPYKAGLIGILVFSLIVRIYYFWLTKDQALWWDSLCYGAIAKSLLTSVWDALPIIVDERSIRPWGIPLLWAGLIKLGVPELFTKFLLEFVPSVLTVYFTYLVAEKMYNKRVALISSFILAVSWMHIFYTMRMLTRVPGLFLSMVSVYYFFKSLEKKNIHFKQFTFSVFTAFLAVLVRWTFGLVGIVYIGHLMLIEGLFAYFLVGIAAAAIVKLGFGMSFGVAGGVFLGVLVIGAFANKKKIKRFRQKQFWLGGIIGSIPIILFFLYNLLTYGAIFPALSEYAASAGEKTSFYYATFGFFQHILGGSIGGFPAPLFLLFVIGIGIMVVQLFLGFGLISRVKKLKSHVFVLFLLALNTAFLVFYIRYSEDRYMFECYLSILLITAYALDSVYLYLKKYNKQLAVILVVVFLASGAYTQYAHGNPIIVSRISSYSQMKSAFLWIKENTSPDSVILGSGIQPYAIYYSDRMPLGFEVSMENNASMDFDYAVVHGFTPHPPEYSEYLDSVKDNLTAVHVEYFNPQNPAVIIYRFDR